MIYEFTIDTATTYAETSKLKTVLKLEKGMIDDLFINFPPGPSGLLYLQVFKEGVQVFPKTLNYFHGDNRLYHFDDVFYPLLNPPFQLEAFTWNDDDTFSHELDIIIEISKRGVFIE